ncbi:response regulator [Bosea sp. 117]|uniref:response regulator n=1 Tax=Bosea sp. 117 TaxID=1125973 RepID=UPI000493BE77|nr:response regulator [Bosea sp. 117]
MSFESQDVVLIALSMVIAMSTAYTAFDLADHVARARGGSRWAWLSAAAVVIAGGAWSMVFAGAAIAGAAFDLPLAIVSFLVLLVAAGFGFYLACHAQVTFARLLGGGVLIGLGVVAMQYLATLALSGATGDMVRVAMAAGAATAGAIAGLWLAFGDHSSGAARPAAAVAMGLGIGASHLLLLDGNAFALFRGTPPEAGANAHLAMAVIAAAFLTLCAAVTAALHDMRLVAIAAREAAALSASEERYRVLYRTTPLPLHSLDSEGRILQVSDRWLGLLGYQRDEVLGRPLTDFMTPESAQRRQEEHWPMLRSVGEVRDAEYQFITKDGETLHCVLSANAERDAEGRITKTSCGLVDVTARRRVEEALRQAQKLEAVGQLTGGIAHDFNNLLAVILGNLELARKRAPDDPRLLRLIDNTIQGAQRGASLTQRMLAFARRQDLKPEPVDVPDLVLGMAELLRRSIGPTVRIETRFPLGLPRARVDANQLELALLNLAVNARDAMPNGGTIVIGAREEEIQEASDSEGAMTVGKYLCLSVADTGAGMDEETLARATEPFFTTKGVGKGTGLGLAMVHGLAAQSGGRLVLKSRVGEGTVAEIYLPIAEGTAMPEDAKATGEPEISGGARSILVVDDDPLVLMSTAAMLEDLGYAVTEASSGHQALDILDGDASIDVVLTDQAMPGMSGVQLAATIKVRRPHLPVILGTGYAELPEGADPSLMRLGKPFDREALERAIAKACPTRGNVVSLSSRHG